MQVLASSLKVIKGEEPPKPKPKVEKPKVQPPKEEKKENGPRKVIHYVELKYERYKPFFIHPSFLKILRFEVSLC